MAISPWFRTDPWLSAILNKPAWGLDPAAARSDPNAEAILAANLAAPCFISAKTGADDLSAVHWLEGVGFHLIDTNLTFVRHAGMIESHLAGKLSVGWAVPEDAYGVRAIARTAFRWSRFHQDPAIETEVAHHSRAEWAGNFFTGQRGNAMVVARQDGAVIGFLQLLGPQPRLVIDLVGVAPDHQASGAGRAMIAFAANHWPECDIWVGTQAANRGSIRFYSRLGFCLDSASYVFHAHGRQGID